MFMNYYALIVFVFIEHLTFLSALYLSKIHLVIIL